MNPALAAVLANPAIWRGGDCAPEPAAMPSGYAALDAVLPGRGWPVSALTEIVLAREGIGEIRLALPALARLQAAGRDVVWITPPHVPYAPALSAAGLDLARLVIVHCRNAADQLWAFEQALRAPECGAAFAWFAFSDDRPLRRLAVAAREGRTWGVLWRRPILVDVACDLTHDRCRALWLQCTDRAVVLAGSVIDDVALIDVAGAGEFCATRTNVDITLPDRRRSRLG